MDKPAIAGGTPVRNSKLFYGHQYIDDADVKAVSEVLVMRSSRHRSPLRRLQTACFTVGGNRFLRILIRIPTILTPKVSGRGSQTGQKQ